MEVYIMKVYIMEVYIQNCCPMCRSKKWEILQSSMVCMPWVGFPECVGVAPVQDGVDYHLSIPKIIFSYNHNLHTWQKGYFDSKIFISYDNSIFLIG